MLRGTIWRRRTCIRARDAASIAAKILGKHIMTMQDGARAAATPRATASAATNGAEVETHGMKPVAVLFAVANAAVLAVFIGLAATGWVEFGVDAVAATSAG